MLGLTRFPRRLTFAALLAWGVALPIVAVWVASARRLETPIPCPLCGGERLTCAHRVAVQCALHAAGIVAIGLGLPRLLAREAAPEERPSPWWALALGTTAWHALALGLELRDVETVMGTGPVLAALGAGLTTSPGVATRVVGWTSVAAAALGWYAVVTFQLSPGDARVPLAAIGAVTLLISAAATVVACLRR